MGDFLLVPTEDVLFQHIFEYLDIIDFMRLRPTCKHMCNLIDLFIRDYMADVNLESLRDIDAFESEHFVNITKNKTNIRVLTVKNCRPIHAVHITDVLSSNKNITSLSLVHFYSSEYSLFCSIGTNLKMLQKLDLSHSNIPAGTIRIFDVFDTYFLRIVQYVEENTY